MKFSESLRVLISPSHFPRIPFPSPSSGSPSPDLRSSSLSALPPDKLLFINSPPRDLHLLGGVFFCSFRFLIYLLFPFKPQIRDFPPSLAPSPPAALPPPRGGDFGVVWRNFPTRRTPEGGFPTLTPNPGCEIRVPGVRDPREGLEGAGGFGGMQEEPGRCRRTQGGAEGIRRVQGNSEGC